MVRVPFAFMTNFPFWNEKLSEFPSFSSEDFFSFFGCFSVWSSFSALVELGFHHFFSVEFLLANLSQRIWRGRGFWQSLFVSNKKRIALINFYFKNFRIKFSKRIFTCFIFFNEGYDRLFIEFFAGIIRKRCDILIKMLISITECFFNFSFLKINFSNHTDKISRITDKISRINRKKAFIFIITELHYFHNNLRKAFEIIKIKSKRFQLHQIWQQCLSLHFNKEQVFHILIFFYK